MGIIITISYYLKVLPPRPSNGLPLLPQPTDINISVELSRRFCYEKLIKHNHQVEKFSVRDSEVSTL